MKKNTEQTMCPDRFLQLAGYIVRGSIFFHLHHYHLLVLIFKLFDDNIRYGRNNDFYKPARNGAYGQTRLV